ncbi:MAG TPA: S8 family serine peptidase [Candidatus Dormibacteraeota bacterium]|nr:S8 family serine peptidase [Candidatus Dormibacteraeota bacterium]
MTGGLFLERWRPQASTANGVERVRLPLAVAVLISAIAAIAGPLGGVAGAQAARSGVVRVVARAGLAGDAALSAAIDRAGGHAVRRIGIIDALIADVPASMVGVLRATPGVGEITPDGPIQLESAAYDPSGDVASALSTTTLTGARGYWRAGYTGHGIDVALIDSGTVPLAGLAGQVVAGPDLSFESTIPALRNLDTFGHGTHMASLIAGRDASMTSPYASDTADYAGMAPDARILSLKVADTHGISDVSQVLAAIDWVVQHAHDPGLNVRVMNLSFGTDSTQSYILDPLAFAAETAWHNGIVVVAAAGNSGWKSGLNNPADDPYLLAVGAADTRATMSTADDAVAPFSAGGDGQRNPDLVAPGVHLQGLRDPGSWIDVNNPQAVLADRFFRGSGTSQSTALVAGAVALVEQQHPGITPDQVKRLLMSTATRLAGQPARLQGAGELNLAAALTAPPVPALLASQLWVPSTGLGSVEASRGTVHVQFTTNGQTLTGERDVHFAAVLPGPLALLEQQLRAWLGDCFNGQTWPNATAPPGGAMWSGSQWSGSQWSGSQWSGNEWSSAVWG